MKDEEQDDLSQSTPHQIPACISAPCLKAGCNVDPLFDFSGCPGLATTELIMPAMGLRQKPCWV